MGPPAAGKPFDPKVTAYILGGCALAVLIGVFTNSWLSARGDIGVGPRGVCYGGTCSWEPVRKGDIEAIGYLTLISGIACAAICGWVAFLCFSNAPNKFPKFKIVNGVLGVAAFATTFFIIRLLIESNKEMSISYSPVFAIGGVITAGVFIRKLKNYWPGEGNTPWPVAVAAAPQPGGWQQPMGSPPGGPPMGGPPMGGPPMGGPPMSPQPQPWGAPPQPQPWAPPHGAAPMAPPPGAPQMGPPAGTAPMGPPPAAPAYGGAPPNAPPMGAPMNAPNAPIGARPMGPPPTGGPPGQGVPTPSIGGAPFGPTNSALPDQYAATVVSSPGPTTPSAPAPSNKATILGAPAPQLQQLLKQQPQQPQAGAQAQAQFCGRCGKPMTFVAQYQRWYCQGCQQYA